ncbi:hypothetical protein ACEWX3_07665 [Mycobacterium sp. G7A2]
MPTKTKPSTDRTVTLWLLAVITLAFVAGGLAGWFVYAVADNALTLITAS